MNSSGNFEYKEKVPHKFYINNVFEAKLSCESLGALCLCKMFKFN